jgi:hypothetical protein
LREYPELKQELTIGKKAVEKTNKNEYEFKKRTGKKSIRDIIKDDLKSVFNLSKNKTDFFNFLKQNNFDLYIRGNTIGIIRDNKKYRLKTLGLLEEFSLISGVIEEVEKRKNDYKKSRNNDYKNDYKKENKRPDLTDKEYNKLSNKWDKQKEAEKRKQEYIKGRENNNNKNYDFNK